MGNGSVCVWGWWLIGNSPPSPNVDTPVRHRARYLGAEGPGWLCQEPGSSSNSEDHVGAAW